MIGFLKGDTRSLDYSSYHFVRILLLLRALVWLPKVAALQRPSEIMHWVVVKIMAPFQIPSIIRPLIFRVPKKRPDF